LAGRLPPQAKARVRVGGRPAATISIVKFPAIEITACEPLAGRLPPQAKARVRAGGRPAATISIVKFPAIEIAACEPLAGRLPPQAKARVRVGGRPPATPAGNDFDRQIPLRLKSLRASRWLVACLRRRKRASAQADARRQRPPATISIVKNLEPQTILRYHSNVRRKPSRKSISGA
jgi:hypothetical protein